MQADGHSARRKFYLFSEHIMRCPPSSARFGWTCRGRCAREPDGGAGGNHVLNELEVIEARIGNERKNGCGSGR
jgi:hypothetical protein